MDWSQFVPDLAVAVVIAVVGYLGKDLFRDWFNKQGRLYDVAVKRTEGVELRNAGVKPLTGKALKDWKRAAAKWEVEAAVVVSKFSRVEGERLKTLDLVPKLQVKGIKDKEQLRLLRNVSGTLWRMDDLLERRVI